MDEGLGDLVAGLGRGGWMVAVASLLTILTAGAAVRLARRLARRSTPELVVLLDQSAAFYRRWPEHRLSTAPRAELLTEAARCRRIVALLQSRAPAGASGGGAHRGAVDGLLVWIAVLAKRIDEGADLPAGPAYA